MAREVAATRVVLASGVTAELQVGREYEITTQLDGEARRIPYRHRMSFLGEYQNGLQFNARPAAGTQTWRATSIIAVTDVGESGGREDDKRFLNVDSRRLCPSCRSSSHSHHQHDFLDVNERVTLCRCPMHKRR